MLYHVSQTAGIRTPEPRLSSHGRPGAPPRADTYSRECRALAPPPSTRIRSGPTRFTADQGKV